MLWRRWRPGKQCSKCLSLSVELSKRTSEWWIGEVLDYYHFGDVWSFPKICLDICHKTTRFHPRIKSNATLTDSVTAHF